MRMPVDDICCDVVVIGGSTAALFAALHAAREGALTCLVEPTDWVGGQLTAAGVPAVDFAWRSNVQGIDTKTAHRLRANNQYELYDWLHLMGNPGNCTVSRHCFLPDDLQGLLAQTIEQEANLSVLNNTVPVAVETREITGKREITGIRLIKRTAKLDGEFPGYERPFSAAISDWYAGPDSEYFYKQQLAVQARNNHSLMVIEASEFGDILALSNAHYLVGEDPYEGATERDFSTSGQSFTFAFNLAIGAACNSDADSHWSGELANPEHSFDLGTYGWAGVWNYRRLKGTGEPDSGQVSVMNWQQGEINNGNDYAGDYLFSSYEVAQSTVDNNRWSGGVNSDALRQAETRSQDFCRWYVSRAPQKFSGAISIDRRSVCTEHGFYKFPYLRESRRSVGYKGFLLCAWDLSFYPGPTGYPFEDRIGTTLYDYDIHALEGCDLKTEAADIYWAEHPKPFFIPLRSLSNDSIANLIVAGKCMAQSFRVNAATRLQPGEAVSGTAAGVVAAYCSLQKRDMHEVIEQRRFREIQTRVSRYQPLQWTINGACFPRFNADAEQQKTTAESALNAHWSDSLAACFDRDFIYFHASEFDLQKTLPLLASPSELSNFEKVEAGGHYFYKVPKVIGFELIELRRRFS